MNLKKIPLVIAILINISIFLYGVYKLKKLRRTSKEILKEIKKYFKNFNDIGNEKGLSDI